MVSIPNLSNGNNLNYLPLNTNGDNYTQSIFPLKSLQPQSFSSSSNNNNNISLNSSFGSNSLSISSLTPLSSSSSSSSSLLLNDSSVLLNQNNNNNNNNSLYDDVSNQNNFNNSQTSNYSFSVYEVSPFNLGTFSNFSNSSSQNYSTPKNSISDSEFFNRYYNHNYQQQHHHADNLANVNNASLSTSSSLGNSLPSSSTLISTNALKQPSSINYGGYYQSNYLSGKYNSEKFDNHNSLNNQTIVPTVSLSNNQQFIINKPNESQFSLGLHSANNQQHQSHRYENSNDYNSNMISNGNHLYHISTVKGTSLVSKDTTPFPKSNNSIHDITKLNSIIMSNTANDEMESYSNCENNNENIKRPELNKEIFNEKPLNNLYSLANDNFDSNKISNKTEKLKKSVKTSDAEIDKISFNPSCENNSMIQQEKLEPINQLDKNVKKMFPNQKNGSSQSSSNNKKTRTKDKYRVVYNEMQRFELEREFVFSKYITSRRKSELASVLDLSQRQIKIWFQNRRAKDRKLMKKKKNEISVTMSDSSKNSFSSDSETNNCHNMNLDAKFNSEFNLQQQKTHQDFINWQIDQSKPTLMSNTQEIKINKSEFTNQFSINNRLTNDLKFNHTNSFTGF